MNMEVMESFGTIRKGKTYDNLANEYEGATYVIPVGLKEDEEPYIVKDAPEEIFKRMEVYRR